MNTITEVTRVLNRLAAYTQAYQDEGMVRRFLGLRLALYDILRDKCELYTPVNSLRPTRCLTCQGTGILAPEDWVEISHQLNHHRFSPNVLVDQCPVTAIDLARRVSMMQDLGDIQGKRVLCIGDNDFASLLIGLTCEPREIVVVENDRRVISFLEEQAHLEKLPLSVVEFDIRSIQQSGCPAELIGRFDVFETDPPYTEVGMKFYISLGMQALKRHGTGYVVIPHMELESWSDELVLSVQRFLLSGGFVLTEVIPGFQTFQHEFEVISTVIRCKRLTYVDRSFNELEDLNLQKFYTIR